MSQKQIFFWNIAFLIWVASTLTFMAGMSIGGTIFIGSSIYFIAKYPNKDLLSFFRGTAFFKATWFLFAISLFSIVYAFYDPPLGLPMRGAHEILKKFLYFLYPFIIAYFLVSFSGKELEKHPFWRVLFFMIGLTSLASIFQFWAADILPQEMLSSHFFRPMTMSKHFHGQGFMQFHLSYASAMGFALSYLLARLFWPMESDSARFRFRLFILIAAASVANFYTFSRISWLAIIVTFILLGFLRRPKLGMLITFFLSICVLFLWISIPDLRFRTNDWMGMQGRVIVWKASVEMVKDRPLTGVGFGKTGQFSEEYVKRAFGTEQWFASHAHNNLLDALASTGIFGLLAYIFWFGILLYYAIRAYQSSNYNQKWLGAACISGWLAFQINGLTQVNFYDAKSQHSLMLWAGIVLALEWRRRIESK